jgi:hypothetical protein
VLFGMQNRIHLVLFDMHKTTLSPCLAAIDRIIISVMPGGHAPQLKGRARTFPTALVAAAAMHSRQTDRQTGLHLLALGGDPQRQPRQLTPAGGELADALVLLHVRRRYAQAAGNLQQRLWQGPQTRGDVCVFAAAPRGAALSAVLVRPPGGTSGENRP